MNTILRNTLLGLLIPTLGSSLIACTSTSPSDSPASPTSSPKASPTGSPTASPSPSSTASPYDTSRDFGGRNDSKTNYDSGTGRYTAPPSQKESSLPARSFIEYLKGIPSQTLFAQAIFPEPIGHGRGTIGFVPIKRSTIHA